MQNLWKQISENLKKEIEKNIYDLWFESVKIKSFINNTMILLVPNIYFQQRIQNDYLSEIKKALLTS
jgi:chromosomal replication initiation ATPase DnaA